MPNVASESLHESVVAHYALAAPLIARSFSGIPLVYAAFPNGFDQDAHWHGPLQHVPNGFKTVPVTLRSGMWPYLSLDTPAIEHVVHRAHAVELHSWTPLATDPRRARFGRILLEPDAQDRNADLASAAHSLRELLESAQLQGIPVLSGTRGIAIYIPFSDAPEYPPLRAWLDALCLHAANRRPNRFTTEPNSHASGRIHLHAGSNAPGRYSALPYSLRGDDKLSVCVPAAWDEVARLCSEVIGAERFPERLQKAGDVFAAQLERIGEQSFSRFFARSQVQLAVGEENHAKAIEPHGHILQAALAILQDGVARDAKTILSEALARKLVPPGTQAKYVYTSLLEYIVRTSGHGHRPAIVQDVDRRFRINEPPDNWPRLDAPPLPAPSPQTQAVIDRLTQTVHGSDPAAFELAVCDAFAHLGFASTHVGGHQAPDGYADAQLGPLGYRVMLECKTGGADVSNPDAVEAGKYRAPYNGQYCAIIGPAFAEDAELGGELQVHGVSAWSVDDLQRLLRIGSNPHEMRVLFAPGFVADSLDTLLWNRLHGQSKRVTLICGYLQEAGWSAQVHAAKQGPPQNAPRLTLDAAMLLVDQRLADEGSSASCSRDEVQSAFDYLTNPRVGVAVWTDTQAKDAIVIVASPVET